MTSLYTAYLDPDREEEDRRRRQAINALSSMADGARMASAGAFDGHDPQAAAIAALDRRMQLEADPNPLADRQTVFGQRQDPGNSLPREPSAPVRTVVAQTSQEPEAEPDDGPLPTGADRAAERRQIDSEGLFGGGDPNEPGVNMWAVVADMITNKGRGLGDIMAMAGQQKAAYQAQQQKLAAQGLDTDLKRAEIANVAKNAELRGAELEYQKAAALQKKQQLENPDMYPESREEKRMRLESEARIAGVKVDDARLQAQLDATAAEREYAHGQDAEARKLQYAQLEEQRRAHDLAASAAADARAAAAAERAQRDADRNKDRQFRRDQQAEKTRIANEERELRHSPLPGTVVENDQAWRARTTTAGEREKMANYVDGVKGAVAALEEMKGLAATYGSELYGQNKSAYDAALTRAVAGYTKIGESGVLNGGEFQRYKAFIPGIEPSYTDAIDGLENAYNAAAGNGQGRNTRVSQLDGVIEETKKLAQAGFGTTGALIDFDGSASRRKKRMDAMTRPQAAPQAPGGGGSAGSAWDQYEVR